VQATAAKRSRRNAGVDGSEVMAGARWREGVCDDDHAIPGCYNTRRTATKFWTYHAPRLPSRSR
jgi:hypothetical protein